MKIIVIVRDDELFTELQNLQNLQKHVHSVTSVFPYTVSNLNSTQSQ
jgi:hypothetical protein